MGEPGGHSRGRGHWHFSHFRRLAGGWGGGVVCLPLPLTPLLAAFPKHLVGAHWVPQPGWTAVSCCGPPGTPASQPARAVPPRTRKGLCPGGGGGALAPALSSGPCLVPRPRAGGGGLVPKPGREEGRGRGPDPTSSPPPLTRLRVRTWWWRQGEGGGSGPEETGSRALGARTGGEGCSPPPPRGPEPRGRAGGARGQACPPTQG